MALFDRIRNLFASPAPAVPPAPIARPSAVPAPSKPAAETPTSRRTLVLKGQDIEALNVPVDADISIDLTGCGKLRSLPDGLTTGTLKLSGCVALERLPARLDVAFLDLAGCTALRELPADLRLRGGRLNLQGCAQLTGLPNGLGEVSQLDLSGCTGIEELPAGLIITSWIDVGDSGIRSLPELYDPVAVRWNGVEVSRRVAFAPETLSREEILAERDPEARRIMVARSGYDLPAA